MNTSEAKRKENMVINVIEKMFKPEIVCENEALQGRLVNEPMVIICNHSVRENRLRLTGDGPILRYAFNNHNVCSLMAKDLMDNKIIKKLIKDCDCIPVCRDAASTDWIHKCKQKLKEGTSVIIFPEGTTYKQNEIEEFKPGFALLAKSANVKVLPVAINGVYKPFHYGALKVKIGVPQELQISRMTPAALKSETKRFQNIVNDLYLSLINNDKEDNKGNDQNIDLTPVYQTT